MTEESAFDVDFDKVSRRDRMMIIRDSLLVLEMEGKAMKPTHFMYSMNVSWRPMVKLVRFLNTKQLVEITKPEWLNRRKTKTDGRSNSRISISLKGKYMLRLLDEMIRYLYDEAPPMINPPIWLLRKALETKGFEFMGELERLDKLRLLVAPSNDPTPFGSFVGKPDDSVIPTVPPSLSLDDRGDVIFSLAEAQSLPPIRDNSPYTTAVELIAGFEVVGTFVPGSIHCPECGQSFWGLKAVVAHVSAVHKDKKMGIIATLNRFRQR